MQFIKFRQRHPDDEDQIVEVAVAVEKIARIEPLLDDPSAMPGGVRFFAVQDEAGNIYNSRMATEAGRKLIEELWAGAV